VSDWFERFGYAEVADGLLTGAYPLDADDVGALAGEEVSRIFNLCEDVEYEPGERDEVELALERFGIVEQRLDVVDYGGLLPGQLEQATTAVLDWLQEGERVYVHCRAGWQRSAAVAAGVVARRDELELDEALKRIRSRKPSAEPLSHQIEDLRRWWQLRSVRRGS
jgi:protein-tyrosine phosphatase